ncbi:KdsC family phosphatase [Gemmatimonadota bacterium]
MKLYDDLEISEDVAAAAARVEMIVMDVDGVLTDGCTYQLDNGEQFLRFSVYDAMGLTLCGVAGIALAVVSGRDVPAARIRMGRFPIAEMHFGCINKMPVLEGLSSRHGISLEKMSYIGDDLIDLPLMDVVGLPVAVANAMPEVVTASRYCTRKRGGDGAVRELIDLVLKARGVYKQSVEQYLKEH